VQKQMNERNIRIDTMRGIACILLVAYHVVGADPSSGLRVAAGWYRELNDLLAYIRMPLFTFLSGFVYAYRPFRSGFLKFLAGKGRRLLLPMFVVGTCFALLQAYTPGTNNPQYDWSTLHIIPVAHFWFIEALFIIFIVVALLELASAFVHLRGFLLIFAISIVLFVSNIHIVYFSLSGAIYLAPFFLIGMAVYRYRPLMDGDQWLSLLFLGGTVIFMALQITESLPKRPSRSLEGLGIGLFFCTGLYLANLKSLILARIGFFSYAIYLYHVFFTAGTRILLEKLGVNNLSILFFWGLLAGICMPIIVEIVFDGSNVTRAIFLGKSAATTEKLWFTRKFLKSRSATE
jgi:peptidoglycan/LPS O-acetylase OafA/YrhL